MKNYIEFKKNGHLFPSWFLKNFKKYKLEKVVQKDGVDPCYIPKGSKLELRKYQEIIGQYLDYKSPYKNILLYHGLGSGKTATTINIYNLLYNYTPGWNIFILIKAVLKDDPWLQDLKKWMTQEDYEKRFKNIRFIHYDSPFADKQFLDELKYADSAKKNMFIIEECHNFISNVYSNINSRKGKRAQTIYDYILEDKKNNTDTRVVCISGTPIINEPYELALLFNLLRPGIFSKSEIEFNQIYINQMTGTINNINKNMFQRRILGLVSYYIGGTSDRFATKTIHNVNLDISDYHEFIYKFYEDIERKIERKNKGSQLYKSYTRQACNFVFPTISQKITGEGRPRPSNFRVISDEDDDKETKKTKKLDIINKYNNALSVYINSLIKYLNNIYTEDKENKHSILNDVLNYKNNFNLDFDKFHKSSVKKSKLYTTLYDLSPKMICIIFNIYKTKGPVIVYSNYVKIEGLEIFKIYLSFFKFSSYNNIINNEKKEKGLYYAEYHGDVDPKIRKRVKDIFNKEDNKYGEYIKIFLISPSGSEGISLNSIRQIHIMEPNWTEVRITQIIGRGIRQCSHKYLPMNERHVDIYRYKIIRPNNKISTDQYIENLALKKQTLTSSFLTTLKEVAVDCILNKNHNMMEENYNCFQFNEQSLFEQNIGPAYKEDIYDDFKINNGLNSINSVVEKIKVRKIKAIVKLDNNNFSSVNEYLYYDKTGVVYDKDVYYPIGRILLDENNLPEKYDKDIYIISTVIDI